MAALSLLCAGCVVGPIDHGGRPPQPGEDLVADLARATRNVAGAVKGVQYEEPIPPPAPQPTNVAPPLPAADVEITAAPAPVAPLPPSETLCIESGTVPFAEPAPLPPPRFFPVPTRPVFSDSDCEPWRLTF